MTHYEKLVHEYQLYLIKLNKHRRNWGMPTTPVEPVQLELPLEWPTEEDTDADEHNHHDEREGVQGGSDKQDTSEDSL